MLVPHVKDEDVNESRVCCRCDHIERPGLGVELCQKYGHKTYAGRHLKGVHVVKGIQPLISLSSHQRSYVRTK